MSHNIPFLMGTITVGAAVNYLSSNSSLSDPLTEILSYLFSKTVSNPIEKTDTENRNEEKETVKNTSLVTAEIIESEESDAFEMPPLNFKEVRPNGKGFTLHYEPLSQEQNEKIIKGTNKGTNGPARGSLCEFPEMRHRKYLAEL